MSEPKHAQLPWRALRVGADVLDASGQTVANCGSALDETDVANARLIARAVNSHEALAGALREVVEALEASMPPGDWEVGIPEFPSMSMAEAWRRRDAARAALAAAEKEG